MALTNTSTAAGGLGRTIGDAVIAFNHVNVMYPLVTVQQAAKGSNHVQFSDWTKLTSSNVEFALSEIYNGQSPGNILLDQDKKSALIFVENGNSLEIEDGVELVFLDYYSCP